MSEVKEYSAERKEKARQGLIKYYAIHPRKGIKHTAKSKEKMRIKALGRKHNINTITKISQQKIEWLKTHSNPMQGKKHTAEARYKQSLKSNGRKQSEEEKSRRSDSAVERYLSGKVNIWQSRSGIRQDLKEYGKIASAFEADYIRYLKYINEPFEYQIPILLSNNHWYICDFYLSRVKQFIELKGCPELIRAVSKDKYKLVQIDYPIIKWRIIYKTSDEWKQMNNKYKYIIPNWEG